MIKNKKITANQFFSALFLGRMCSSLLYTPLFGFDISVSERIFAEPLSAILSVMLVLPLYIGARKNKAFLGCGRTKLQKLAVILCAVYFLFSFILYGTVFAFFAQIKLLEGFGAKILFLMICAAGFYGALKGGQTIGRTSAILCTLALNGIIVMLIVSFREFSSFNLVPLTNGGFGGITRYILFSAFSSAELLAGCFFVSDVDEFKKGKTAAWIAALCAAPALLSLAVSGIFGDIGGSLPFPIFRLASVGRYVLFSRLDSVFAFIWISVFAVKTALLLYAVKKSMEKLSPAGKCTVTFSTVSAVCVLLSASLSTRFVKLPFAVFGVVFMILFFTAAGLLLLAARKERGSR